jgi:hypothetical protein
VRHGDADELKVYIGHVAVLKLRACRNVDGGAGVDHVEKHLPDDEVFGEATFQFRKYSNNMVNWMIQYNFPLHTHCL